MGEKCNSEVNIQNLIFVFYNNKYCLKHHSPRSLIFSVPNGGTRNRLEAMTFKATGLLPGASDLIIIHHTPNKSPVLAFVEVKAEKGKLSPAQEDFRARVEALGFLYTVVRSLEEFNEFINKIENI